MNKYLCTAKCPELDCEDSGHCIVTDLTARDFECPCGNKPFWVLQDPWKKEGTE